MSTQSEWPQERTDELCRLWDLGESASKIAIALGVNRNAVIGKVHRLRKGGYPFKRKAQTREQIASNAKAARLVQEVRRAKREAAGVAKEKTNGFLPASVSKRMSEETARLAEPVIIDASFSKPWTERRFGECAYPIGGEGADTVSCCAPTKGKTYCRGHRALMFRKPLKTGDQYVKATARLAA